MTDVYHVAVFNKPLRIFDMTVPQIVCIPIATMIAFCATNLAMHIHVLSVPLRVGLFILFFTGLFTAIRCTDIKPLHWWLRYAKYVTSKKIPIGFPELELSNTNKSSMRLSKPEFANLTQSQQMQMLDLLTDFAGKPGNSVQIFAPAASLVQNKFEREFYIVSESARYQINDLAENLQHANLPARPATDETMRKLLFAYLSPGHQAIELPPVSFHNNDVLTLCTSGFDQQKDHIRIDGKFVSSFYFQSLPTETYFGFLNRLMDIDCNISLSTFIKCSKVANIKKVIEMNYRIERLTASGELETAPLDSAKIRRFSSDVKRMVSGQIPAIDLSVYLTIFADTHEELVARINALQNFALSFGGKLSPATVQEFDALLTVLPLNKDLIDCSHTVVPLTAQTFVPFT